MAAALGSVGQADGSASIGSSVRESAAGVQLSLPYVAVTSVGSCPAYRGANEGTALSVSIFDYGTVGFTPSEIVVNSTAYAGGFQTAGPGALETYSISLAACAHASGLTILALDAMGDEFQFES